jgi:putative transposase
VSRSDRFSEASHLSQSNERIERWHNSLKRECIRQGTPLSLEDARHLAEGYGDHYNNVRLNSAIRYITLRDMPVGRQDDIDAWSDRMLDEVRKEWSSEDEHSEKL